MIVQSRETEKPATGNDKTINLGPGEGKKQARNYKKRLDGKKTEKLPRVGRGLYAKLFPFLFTDFDPPILG